MAPAAKTERSVGLVEATSIGVGAIVGGGILILAGAALATTGPSAVLAFALNGLIALITALSFAELAAAFPESGGTYTFAKKTVSVEAAFAVGWVTWFASMAAAALYALGFGYFAAVALDHLWRAWQAQSPDWLLGRPVVALLAAAAVACYAVRLGWRTGGGAGHWENVGKLAVFAILIAAGLATVTGRSAETLGASFRPFFSAGAKGLFQAMGFTFIALQGFDLIAAAGGEIRDPGRTIPRAMFLSLGIALLVYLPLLLVIAAAGVAPGQSIAAASREHPEEIVALAAQNFLGPFGYWLVVIAAILSMLSALRANLFAASRVAQSMARDRTMPRSLSRQHPMRGTPTRAILATALVIVAIVVALPGVTAAGAAASLIFLLTFALAHWIAVLARRRAARPSPFQVPWFPLVPIAGMAACVALAVYQGIRVPSAGYVAAAWLCVGGLLFMGLFARPARIVDASTEAQDPEVTRLRGRTPLVLVPVANPHNAESMIAVAHALAPPQVGRVLLLSVAVLPKGWQPGDKVLAVRHAQRVLGDTLTASLKAGHFPEALATAAADPWREISRVAREHRCESMLLGFTEMKRDAIPTPLGQLLTKVACDVVVLRAPPGWRPADARRILVPAGGRGWHDRLRARLLGSLFRTGDRDVVFLRVLPQGKQPQELRRARRELARIADREAPGRSQVELVEADDVVPAILARAAEADLVILGVERASRRQKAFGPISLRIVRETSTPVLIISCRH